MLIEFSVGNYLSIKDTVTISLLASNTVKELEGNGDDLCNVFYDISNTNKYIKSAVIYGANGSGKSNLLKAFGFFKEFILSSANDRHTQDEINIIPFLLSTISETEPSEFEMVFVIDSCRYRYGFMATKQCVVSEWLFVLDLQNTTKESKCFTREQQNIKVNTKKFAEGKGFEKNTRPNALFLSTIALLNGLTSTLLQQWFYSHLNILSGLNIETTGPASLSLIKFQIDPIFRIHIIDFFKLLNIGIEDIKTEKKMYNIQLLDTLPKNEEIYTVLEKLKEKPSNIDNIGEIRIKTIHKKFNELGEFKEYTALDLMVESDGTKKLFGLLSTWFDVLENGGLLIIDELDARLHTKLTFELLKIFHSKINKKNAQLIFASHDTNLLRNDLFRRDQIWFTEKRQNGASDLYSLVEYKINQATSIRNDAVFEKDYLLGKYGAIPYFGNIAKFLNEFGDEQKTI